MVLSHILLSMNAPKENLNLAFSFDYEDFSAYLARDGKNREKTDERLGSFHLAIDFFKKKYHCDDKEAFKQLKKRLEWAKKEQLVYHQKREVIVNILADQTKPYPDADDSQQEIFPSARDDLISNYLWYCKRAKNAHEKGIIAPIRENLKKNLILKSQEEANQEIYDEIKILEEQFNEEGGTDPELRRKIAELKSLL